MIFCKHCGKDLGTETVLTSFLDPKKTCLACYKKGLKEKVDKGLGDVAWAEFRKSWAEIRRNK